jgi:hypothetical protein
MNWKRRAVMAVLLLVAGCASEQDLGAWSQEDFEGDFGKKWPLTVPVGGVRCTRLWLGQPDVFFSDGSNTYSFNLSVDGSDTCEYTRSSPCPIDLIVKPDPKNPRAKMDISPLRNEVLRRCMS